MLSNQKLLLMIGDFAAYVLAFYTMSALRFATFLSSASVQFQSFLVLFVLWLIVFFVFDLYTAPRINPNPRTIGLIALAMATNIVLGIIFFYISSLNGISPKTNLVIVAVFATVLVVVWRRICYILFTKHFVRTIVLIGESPQLAELETQLGAYPGIGKIIGTYTTIPDHAVRADILIADGINPQTLLVYARSCGAQPLSIFEAYELILTKIPVELMTEERALAYLNNQSTSAIYIIYRVLEIIGASLVLIISSPFLVIGAIAKWLEDGGPVLYSQIRVGKDGKPFHMYKLRSMQTNAESGGALWADKKDSRITPVGNILRKTHLDEVPQMWNIIKGDLAAIGPRAERPEFVALLEREIPFYYLRHTIKPGFTGWAQIKYRYARSIKDSKEKFEYDLYYLKNHGVLLDIGIVLKTLQIIFTH